MSNDDRLSLYLHIPFCGHRCSYCDFNTYTSLGDLKGVYAEALAAEIRQVGGEDKRKVKTIFFGGGTPSLMSPEQLGVILGAVDEAFELVSGAEVSMEANPGTVDEAYLGAVRALGINRLSFGVQSVVASELALLERQHDWETVVKAVGAARAAGFDNFNLDLIYGVPGQTLASWERSLEGVLSLEPTHLSLYCLTIEPGTPMHRWLHQGQMAAPDGDLAADQYEMAGERLAGAGWEHYEISNWGRPGRPCEHNLTYWRNGAYLGLGAGAHGHAEGYRYHVVKQPRVYIRRLLGEGWSGEVRYPWSGAVAEWYELTREERMADVMITQLRLLAEGVDLAGFEAMFGVGVEGVWGDDVRQLKGWGLLAEVEGRLLLTERGRFLSNQVFVRFV
ncbi:MAG TPA: radical SAM family heme chaperone HemW [Anaerolineae bacterium]|nr:radical SAM family heme chaperone HemW [Anaerolineae bacterium]